MNLSKRPPMADNILDRNQFGEYLLKTPRSSMNTLCLGSLEPSAALSLSKCRRVLFTLCLIFHFSLFTFHSFSQGIAINTSGAAPNNSAMLDVSGTSQGVLINRMTSTERDAISAPIPESLLIYNTTTKCFEAYSGSIWQSLSCLCTSAPSSVSASASQTTLCSGSTLTLTGSALGANNWSWTGPNNFVSSLQNPTITNVSAGTGVYTLTVSNACGSATAVNTAMVTVNPLPILTSSLTPSSVCSNSTFSYTPTCSTGGTTFNWSRAMVTGISNSSATGTGSPEEILLNTTSDPVNVTYIYTLSANGCSNIQNVVVAVNPVAAAVTANAANGIGSLQFKANWNSSANATSYCLDVSLNTSFSSFVSGYSNLNVGNVTSYNVTGLAPSTVYYYRVRPVNSCAGGNSNIVSLTTFNIASNIVAYWKFDETNGGAADAVGSYPLTNNNTVGYSTGKISNGADFGSSNTNKSFSAGSTIANSLYNTSFSISCWFKISTQPSTGNEFVMVSITPYSPEKDISIKYSNETGTKQIVIYKGNYGGTDNNIRYNINLTSDIWYHVVYVYTNNTLLEGYLNGTSIGTISNPYNNPTGSGSGSNLFISSWCGSSRFISGLIDEVGIWSRALSSAEVSALYNSGNGIQYPF
ncbi:MAG: hypothetical protein HGB12_06045 [Bacteroidetes bacterium]|nr:hypothetical protein [Bacteroidota bacterium]